MAISDESEFIRELKEKLPSQLLQLLDLRDGAGRLASELGRVISSKKASTDTRERRAWELAGLLFLNQGRFHEALPVFQALYRQMLLEQESAQRWVEKGMPLVWISDCYAALGYRALAKRYLMLTLCEDAIREAGKVSPETTGSYFRAVRILGLPDFEFRRYTEQAYGLAKESPAESRYPEWILQELDQQWMTEYPVPPEAAAYVTNTLYVQHLLNSLGDQTGKILERLAAYILSCMPGCRTTRRQRSGSTDYDIVCSVEGLDVDFRSELGRYFVCECKDWEKAADFTTMAKFCRVLDSTKSRFGILFSKHGITGQGEAVYAEREQIKVFQDRGMVIVVVSQSDLEYVARGGHFTNLLRKKYEGVRLDIVGGA